MEQQPPHMAGMTASASYSTSASSYSGAPAPQRATSQSGGGDDCCDCDNGCCSCSNNHRSALYTWLPIGMRIGILLCCLVSFGLALSPKYLKATEFSEGRYLVAITVLGFIFAVFLLVYLIVRIFVAGSEAYDPAMDLANLIETYIMSLLLFAAAVAAAAAVSTTGTLGYFNDDLDKIKGASALAFLGAFTYIALFWYYAVRMYQYAVLRGSRNSAPPAPAAAKGDAPLPYNV